MSRSSDRTRRPEKAANAGLRGNPAEGVARAGSVRAVSDDGTRSSGSRPASGNSARDRTRSGTVSGREVAPVKRYRVVLERDEGGAWIATVPAVPGCHTYGRSLVEARRRVRGVLRLWVEDADTAELADDVRISHDASAAVRRSRDARHRLATARDTAGSATSDAVHRLVDELGLGVRDVAYLLGLSHQRVQQLRQSS